MVRDDGTTFIAISDTMARYYESKGYWRSGEQMDALAIEKGPPSFEEWAELERAARAAEGKNGRD